LKAVFCLKVKQEDFYCLVSSQSKTSHLEKRLYVLLIKGQRRIGRLTKVELTFKDQHHKDKLSF